METPTIAAPAPVPAPVLAPVLAPVPAPDVGAPIIAIAKSRWALWALGAAVLLALTAGAYVWWRRRRGAPSTERDPEELLIESMGADLPPPVADLPNFEPAPEHVPANNAPAIEGDAGLT